LFKTLPVKAQNDEICQIFFGGMAPLAPSGYTCGYKKRMNSRPLHLMFNLLLTKSSQQRKTARHCRNPMKSNIVSFGCYVWLLPTRVPTKEIASWSSIC